MPQGDWTQTSEHIIHSKKSSPSVDFPEVFLDLLSSVFYVGRTLTPAARSTHTTHALPASLPCKMVEQVANAMQLPTSKSLQRYTQHIHALNDTLIKK